MKTKSLVLILVTVAVLVFTGVVSGCAPTPTRITWEVGSSSEGSSGYIITGAVCSVVNQHLKDYVEMLPIPYGISVEAQKAFDKGEVDCTTAGATKFEEVVMKVGAFAPDVYEWKRPVALWIWMYDVVMYDFIEWKDRDEITCYSDLVGKRVYIMPIGTGGYTLRSTILGPKVVNIIDKVDIEDFPMAHVGDALKLGEIDSMAGFGVGKASGFTSETLSKVKVKLLVLTPEELEKLKRAEPVIDVELDPTEHFDMDVGVYEPVKVFAMAYGFWVDPDADEEFIYRLTKCVFENADELVSIAPSVFHYYGKDPIGYNLKRFEMVRDRWGAKLPIHRGVNRYFKEIGYDLEEMGFDITK